MYSPRAIVVILVLAQLLWQAVSKLAGLVQAQFLEPLLTDFFKWLFLEEGVPMSPGSAVRWQFVINLMLTLLTLLISCLLLGLVMKLCWRWLSRCLPDPDEPS